MHTTLSRIFDVSAHADQPFFLIAGPCVLENEEMGFPIAAQILEITERLAIPFIFKASYRKANRTKGKSFTGIGNEKALAILDNIRKDLNIPVLTDVHAISEVQTAAGFVDVLQIPAFLCRQTDLLEAAGAAGRVVNIKKGQFMSPESMQHAAEKVLKGGCKTIWVTERGTTFGYNDLVVDFRSIPVMKNFIAPEVKVVLDATHSLQRPNQGSGISGGSPGFIETIASAGIAAGADGIFLETHPDPVRAKSDAGSMLPLDKLEGLLHKLVGIREAIRGQ